MSFSITNPPALEEQTTSKMSNYANYSSDDGSYDEAEIDAAISNLTGQDVSSPSAMKPHIQPGPLTPTSASLAHKRATTNRNQQPMSLAQARGQRTTQSMVAPSSAPVNTGPKKRLTMDRRKFVAAFAAFEDNSAAGEVPEAFKRASTISPAGGGGRRNVRQSMMASPTIRGKSLCNRPGGLNRGLSVPRGMGVGGGGYANSPSSLNGDMSGSRRTESMYQRARMSLTPKTSTRKSTAQSFQGSYPTSAPTNMPANSSHSMSRGSNHSATKGGGQSLAAFRNNRKRGSSSSSIPTSASTLSTGTRPARIAC